MCNLKTDIQKIVVSQLLLHTDTVSDNKKPFISSGLVTVIARFWYVPSVLCCGILAEEQMDGNAETTVF